MHVVCLPDLQRFDFQCEGLKLRFLILEDSPIQVDVLTLGLSRIFEQGFCNKATDRLEEFKELAPNNQFDALFVDLNVLDAKAADVAAALRNLPSAIQRKVIVFSSESWSEMTRLGLINLPIVPKGASRFELIKALKGIGAL